MDIKALTKEELVAEYNKLADVHGYEAVEDFKTLGAGRSAYRALVKATTPKVEKAPRAAGVGAFAKGLLVDGVSNKDTLEAVLAKFPEAKTTSGCIAYYRTKLIKEGKLESTRKPKEVAEEAAA